MENLITWCIANIGSNQLNITYLIKNPNYVNPFSTNAPLLHPLKTSENLRFSHLIKGYRSGTLVQNGLIIQTMFHTYEASCVSKKKKVT